MKKEQNEYKCLDIAKKHFLDQEFYDLDKCLNESESILLNLKSI